MNDLTKVKKAIILAGGQKTRLSPLDKHHPIWMFPIINRPLIFFTINLLKENGIEEVMIAMSENDKIPHRLKEYNPPSINLHFHKEDKPRGTAGVLKDIEAFIGREPFLVINSNLFVGRMDLAEFIRFHIERDSIATVGVYRDSNNGIEEGITLASDKTIKGFHRIHSSIDKRSPWRPSGIYIFNPSVLKFIDQNSYMDIKEQLIPALQKKALSVSAYEIEGFHMCFNSINDYINLHRYLFLKSGYIDYLENREEIAKGVWAGKDAKISSKAYLLGPIIIGDGCKIKDWAQIIGPAVIGNGCQISEGVLVRESILWNGVSLSDGTKIEYSIIGEGSNIPNNYCIKNMVIMNGISIEDPNLIPSDYSIKGLINLSNIVLIANTKQKAYKIVKKTMDIALSAVGIVLLLPLLLLIAIAIKIDSPGHIFYTQKRCGKNGKLFNMIKFRTMVVDAEKIHKELIFKKDTDGPMFKMVNDPRITRLGRFLRKSSIDEIPQLINVLRGEMSLVGPRPLLMDEMQFSPSWRDTRLKVKPGITGLWQIQGRGEAPFHDWIRYDAYYVKNQSLWLDLKILLKTIKVVLKKVGAY